MPTIKQLISQNAELGSLPAIVTRIYEVIANPKSSAIQIGRIINEDPALAGRLLKVVNSPFYGFRSKVDTVYRAIALIGHKELYNLVLATSAVKKFSGVPNDLVDMKSYWHGSLYCGILARILASYRRESEIERYFVIGLLHDIGSLLLYSLEPERSAAALERSKKEQIPIWQSEQEEFGFDHAELGAELLKCWGLPSTIVEAVHYHIRPSYAPTHEKEATLVHLAWNIVKLEIEKKAHLPDNPDIDISAAWKNAGIDCEALPEILEKAAQHYDTARRAILD